MPTAWGRSCRTAIDRHQVFDIIPGSMSASGYHPPAPHRQQIAVLSTVRLHIGRYKSPHPGRAPAFHRKTYRLNYRSEEHTSELQSREKLVCRLLPEKTKSKV